MQVQVVKVTERSGNKNGKAWAMTIASAVVTNDDGSVAVGQIIMPKDHPKVEPGFYTASVGAVESMDGMVFGVQKLTPAKPALKSATGS